MQKLRRGDLLVLTVTDTEVTSLLKAKKTGQNIYTYIFGKYFDLESDKDKSEHSKLKGKLLSERFL